MRPRLAAIAVAIALAGAAHAGGNRVVDGSFGAGLSSWNPLYLDPTDSAFVYSFSGSDDYGVACPGSSCLAAGPAQTLTLTQLIATPELGTYQLSFDLRSLVTFSSDSAISVRFGGATLFHSAATEIGDWRHVSVLTGASAATTTLAIDFVAPAGNYYLGNVSLVSAVPEPQSYLMWLAGLAVVGWAVRRQSA